MKDPAKEARTDGRIPAPAMVEDTSYKARKAMLNRLNAENPGFVHVFQHPDVGDWELGVKGQEVVRDEKNRVLHHRGDPVVRMPKERFESEQKAEAQRSVETVVGTGVLEEDVAIKMADRKRPKERKKG